MITPIRGRKPGILFNIMYATSSIRNDNPDKGTETIAVLCKCPFIQKYMIRNDNPDKGTETPLSFNALKLMNLLD